jgi:hypothetical protein
MYEIIPYLLHAPSDEGDTARKVDYKSLQSKVNARVLCRAQYSNGLPKVFQIYLINQTRVKWKTLSDSDDWHAMIWCLLRGHGKNRRTCA